jgi:serine/threonine protein kinase
MTARACPDVGSWQALLDGAEAAEPDDLVGHLETCADCRRTLEALAADPSAWQDARSLAQERRPAAETALLLRVTERLKGDLPPSAEDLSFLRPADKPGLLGLLGPYEVQEEIGRGGMGLVLKALDPALNRVVALKVLAPALAGSATARRRFVREGRAAAAISHDHVLTIFAVEEADGLPYLVMPYVAGRSLQDRLDRRGPPPRAEAVRIAWQTACGLAAAHARGVVHRDVKPANILLEGADERVKLTDFGLAWMGDDARLTQAGVAAGTPEYMAPEQARGEPVDHRADLFSLGGVLYALCTGVPPFRGATALAVLRKVNDEAPPPLRRLNPAAPAWLEALTARLLDKDPARRLQSAGQVASLLEGYLAHLRRPAAVRAPALPFAPGERPRRRRAALGLAAVLLTLLGVSWWLAGQNPPAAPQGRAPAEFYQDFRKDLHPSFVWSGRDGEEELEPDARGLRVKLPPTRKRRDPMGPTLTVPVTGSFEITAGYEVLTTERPGAGGGVGFELYTMLETPTRDALALGRLKTPDAGDVYLCSFMTTRDGKRRYDSRLFPAPASAGRLRLSRKGTEVVCWAAEGAGDFRELCRFEAGAADVKFIRVAAYPGQSSEPVDVRLVDLRVRSDAPILDQGVDSSQAPAGAPARAWLAALEGLGLLLTLAAAVVLGLWLRRRGRAAKAPGCPAEDEPAAATAFLFPCPGCRKNLRARPELVGRKVKCPECGQAGVVPPPRTDQGGRIAVKGE